MFKMIIFKLVVGLVLLGPAYAAAAAAATATTATATPPVKCKTLLNSKPTALRATAHRSSAHRFCPTDKKDELGFCFDTQAVPITPDNILTAYQQGAFVWSVDASAQLNWYNPPEHGVIELSKLFELGPLGHYKFKILRKLMRRAYSRGWQIKFNQNFQQVVQACAEHTRPNVEHVWLTSEVQKTFMQLHAQGMAHSVEVYDAHGTLIGGNYGLWLDGVYSSESMFYRESGAGKLSMYAVMSHLHQLGAQLVDTQVVNFVSGPAFLAQNISLTQYLQMRQQAARLQQKHKPLKTPFSQAFNYPLKKLGL